MAAKRAGARVRLLGVPSTAVAARLTHPPPVSRRFTRRCLSQLVLDPTVTLMMTLPALSLAPVPIIR